MTDGSTGEGTGRSGDGPAGMPARREAAIDALCEHFARDAFDVEELERRVDRVHQARSVTELEAILRDLPGGLEVLSETGEDAAAPTAGRPRARVPAERVGERSTVIAVMGENVRRGRWVPSAQINCVAFWGGVTLDFREALLGPGVTEVNVLAVMGGVEIVVPPGLYVESSGLALMGGFENAEDHPVDADSDAPVLQVHGFALMGGVEITSRYPGESRRDARIRRKEERRGGRRRLEGS